MKTKNFNLTFYLKKPKGYESGILPIYLRISVDGKRSEATIGRGIEPEKWDEKFTPGCWTVKKRLPQIR
jgi:hypothetical protein